MRVALIKPGGDLSGDAEFSELFNNVYASSILRPTYSGTGPGLLVVAALTPREVELEFLDETTGAEIRTDAGYDLVCLTAHTSQAPRAYEIADAFRAAGVPVVIGGIHATLLPDEAKLHADSVAIGEAENFWPRMFEDFVRGRLAPFYRSEALADLSRSPVPRYDLLLPKPGQEQSLRSVWLQATRGCPHDCEFCAASRVYGSRYRRKSVSQVIAEVHFIEEKLGVRSFSFADDNLLVDRGFAHRLMEELTPFGLTWFAQSDITVAEDLALLPKLKTAGCNILFVGFETLTEEGMRHISVGRAKATRVSRYREYVERIQGHGIGVQGAFVVGIDSDGPDVFDRITDFALSTNMYSVQITILTPLPGTAIREKLLEQGRVTNLDDWGKYNFNEVNFVPAKISATELKNGVLQAYRRIYGAEANLQRLKYFKEVFKKRLPLGS